MTSIADETDCFINPILWQCFDVWPVMKQLGFGATFTSADSDFRTSSSVGLRG